jgi:hypothetical protein
MDGVFDDLNSKIYNTNLNIGEIYNNILHMRERFNKHPFQAAHPITETLMQAASISIEHVTHYIPSLSEGYLTLIGVIKPIKIGPRGGAYYINSRGNKIWLKNEQIELCRQGKLLGAGNTCPQEIKQYNTKNRMK